LAVAPMVPVPRELPENVVPPGSSVMCGFLGMFGHSSFVAILRSHLDLRGGVSSSVYSSCV
jgi:hypothetical protein